MIIGDVAVLPLPDVNQLVGEEHGGQQQGRIGVGGHVIACVEVRVHVDCIEYNRGGGGACCCGPLWWGQQFSGAGGARGDGVGGAVELEDGRGAQADFGGVEIGAMELCGEAGFRIGERAPAGAKGQEYKENGNSHEGRVARLWVGGKGLIWLKIVFGKGVKIFLNYCEEQMKIVYLLMLAGIAGCAEVEVPTGAALFADNCTACHGADATGSGWVGAGLQRKPADLTLLSNRNGGVFPMQMVLSTIDGFHRNPRFETAMPEFGSFFSGPMDQIELDGVMTPVPEPLLLVAEYLRSLQK